MLFIATLAEAKSNLGITDAADDQNLTEMLEGIQGRFDSFCRRGFLYGTGVTELFDGGCTHLAVYRWPIDTISAVFVDADQVFAADTLLEDDEYRVNKTRGLIYYGTLRNKWPDGVQNVQVIYNGGFVKSDGSVAPGVSAEERTALRRALFLQVGFEWRNRRQLGNQTVSNQGASISLAPADLLPDVKNILEWFKRI